MSPSLQRALAAFACLTQRHGDSDPAYYLFPGISLHVYRESKRELFSVTLSSGLGGTRRNRKSFRTKFSGLGFTEREIRFPFWTISPISRDFVKFFAEGGTWLEPAASCDSRETTHTHAVPGHSHRTCRESRNGTASFGEIEPWETQLIAAAQLFMTIPTLILEEYPHDFSDFAEALTSAVETESLPPVQLGGISVEWSTIRDALPLEARPYAPVYLEGLAQWYDRSKQWEEAARQRVDSTAHTRQLAFDSMGGLDWAIAESMRPCAASCLK